VLTQCPDVYLPECNEAYAVANPQNLQTIICNAKPLDSDSILSAYLHATSHLDEHILNTDVTLVTIHKGMHDNAFAMQICEQLKTTNDNSPPPPTSFTFSEDSMLLLYKGCIYVPDYHDAHLTILCTSHDHLLIGHPGIHKTICLVMRKYYWPGLTKMVKLYVGSCVVCATLNCHTMPHTVISLPAHTVVWMYQTWYGTIVKSYINPANYHMVTYHA
jgi:Integrase zinc binding domain